jgi:hypothetical protein
MSNTVTLSEEQAKLVMQVLILREDGRLERGGGDPPGRQCHRAAAHL